MRRKLNNRGFWTPFIVLGVVGAGALILGNLWLDDANVTLIGVLKTIGVFIDCQIYSVAAWAYSIFYELSSSSLLNSLNLAGASQRLYTLLGIFMLFRLAFSFVKYIINPDGMEKGTSKLVTNLAVSLALIVSVPWIFNRAFALQSYIMESNVIGNLIMGMNTSKDGEDNFNAASYGQNISFLTFSAFYRPNTSISVLSPCSNLLTYYSKYVVPSGDKTVTVDPGEKNEDDPVIIESKKIAQCVNALNGNDNSLGAIETGGNDVEIGTIFYIASQRQSIGMFSNSGLLSAKIGNDAVISYTAIVSAIAGGFLALLFLNFSFDVAIRNVKLCFLQIIAPIPIILNIEPGDAKADKKPLNWWIKECLRTYTDLFVRIATIYFGVFLINELFGGGVTTGNSNNSPWFQVFMILGILLFVKQVPDMIGKAFGIDVKGQFNLNPLKRLRENKLTGGLIGGVAGLMAGRTLGAAIGGIRDGAAGKKITENMRNQAQRGRSLREARAAGSTFGGRTMERFNRTFGTNLGTHNNPTTASVNRQMRDIDNEIRRIDNDIAQQQDLKRGNQTALNQAKMVNTDRSAVSSLISSVDDRAISKIQQGKGEAGVEYLRRKSQIDAMKARTNFTASDTTLHNISAAEEMLNKEMGKKHVNQTLVSSLQSGLEQLRAQAQNEIVTAERENARQASLLESRLETDLKTTLRDSYINEHLTNGAALGDSQMTRLMDELQTATSRLAGDEQVSFDGLTSARLHDYDDNLKNNITGTKNQMVGIENIIRGYDKRIEGFTAQKERLQGEKRTVTAEKDVADFSSRAIGGGK